MKIPLIWLKDYVETEKSAKELAASFTQLGLMLDKPLGKDNVLDLEHRMDRADWLSIIGCARDLAAFENTKLNVPKAYGKPGKKADPKDHVKIEVTTPSVRRFQTRVFRDIKVGPSPKWLVEKLSLYGMDSINNIVDITNFVMVEYGQPMHAQDLAKLKGQDISIRQAKPGEKLTTLLGTEVTLDADAFVLTSGGEVTVIGGIVGGKQTGVTEDTTDIILDSGNYDSRVIRKVSRRLKIMNESVSRNDKFLDPRLIDAALSRATALILELAGGTYYENGDYYPSPAKPKTQTLRLSRLHLLSGMDITLGTAKKILKSLDYAVVEEGEDTLTLEIPYFRTDVEVEDDLVADILRIHNYTTIPVQAMTTPVPTDITPSIYRFEDRLRDLMVAQGAHEHITSSLVTATNQSGQVMLANALSTDQNALRTNLVDGLKQVLTTYKKHNQENVVVFEIGKVFSKDKKEYLEHRQLTAVGRQDVRDSLATLLISLGIKGYLVNENLEIFVDDKNIGSMTQDRFTVTTDRLMALAKNYKGIVSEFKHSPTQDLSYVTPSKVPYFDLITAVNENKGGWEDIAPKAPIIELKGQGFNSLITVTWPPESKSIESDKKKIATILQEKFNAESKS